MDSSKITKFYKYQGTGNDFVIIHDPGGDVPTSAPLIAHLCDRRLGIGADGLILIRPHAKFDYEMVYFNADGHRGSMCGNGARCTYHCANHLGLAGSRASFEAFDGAHEASRNEHGLISVTLRPVQQLAMDGEACVLDTGSPHYVSFVSRIEDVDVLSEGKTIRYSPVYREQGINVNFVEARDNVLVLRTYERGVEDITLSCGTGATAAALAYAGVKDLQRGPIHIETLGGALTVDFERSENGFEKIRLSGRVLQVYTGEIPLPIR